MTVLGKENTSRLLSKTLHLLLSACWLHSLRSASPCSWGHMAIGCSELINLKLMVWKEKWASHSALIWKIPGKDSDWSNLGHISTPGPLGASLVAQILKNLPVMQETQVQSLGQEDPLEKGMATTPVFLAGELSSQFPDWLSQPLQVWVQCHGVKVLNVITTVCYLHHFPPECWWSESIRLCLSLSLSIQDTYIKCWHMNSRFYKDIFVLIFSSPIFAFL